jgi:capsular polysaccharide biosynthesis protein
MMSAGDATAFLRQRFNTERQLDGDRRIYVSRLDADPSRRRVYHEELLVAALQQAGFEILVPSEMSFQDQVDAFASATVIVGPHGAGMTNLAFAQKECLAVEIVNTHNRNYRFFSDIADAVGLRYARFLSGSERANFIEPENANSIVDPKRLLSFIDQMQAG